MWERAWTAALVSTALTSTLREKFLPLHNLNAWLTPHEQHGGMLCFSSAAVLHLIRRRCRFCSKGHWVEFLPSVKAKNLASLSLRSSLHFAEGERVAPDVWLGTARSWWPRVNLACNKTARLHQESELLPAYVRGPWIEIDLTSVNGSPCSVTDH